MSVGDKRKDFAYMELTIILPHSTSVTGKPVFWLT
jgi:hypothetical protein